MYPDKQRGIGLIAALFLIVVVASLAVGVASLVRTGSAGYAQDVLGYKAFLAAESGAQLALNRLYAPVGAGSCANRVFALDSVGLNGCSAATTCSSVTVAGAQQYDVGSAGRCATAADAAERRIVVRALP
jgi:MSHA biogenesis protein MshP